MRRRDASEQLDTKPTVLLPLADRTNLQTADIKDDAIVINGLGQHVFEDCAQSCFAEIAGAKQVDVACDAVVLTGPDKEQRRAFEHEMVGVFGAGEAVQQTLVGVARE